MLIVLHVLTNTGALSGAAAALSPRWSRPPPQRSTLAGPIRSLLSVLAPAPLVFAALFLFASQASDVIFASTPEVQAASFESRMSVVLVVFDELSSASLMGRNQRIDAAASPNSASLAGDSTWYRGVTTEYGMTEGRRAVDPHRPRAAAEPCARLLPVPAERLHDARQPLPHACRRVADHALSANALPHERRESARVVESNTESLVSDAGIVYLHLVVPKPYVDHVPAIDESWGNFGRHERERTVRRGAQVLPCARNVCEFTKLIDGSRRPTLYFLHTLLPHIPYEYLPSGRATQSRRRA